MNSVISIKINSGRVTENFARQYQLNQFYIRTGFSLPVQAPFFLIYASDSAGTNYCPCIMPRSNEKKTDSNLYQRKEACVKTIYVHVQQQQNCFQKKIVFVCDKWTASILAIKLALTFIYSLQTTHIQCLQLKKRAKYRKLTQY